MRNKKLFIMEHSGFRNRPERNVSSSFTKGTNNIWMGGPSGEGSWLLTRRLIIQRGFESHSVRKNNPVAQLGEYLAYIQEVIGSRPIRITHTDRLAKAAACKVAYIGGSSPSLCSKYAGFV